MANVICPNLVFACLEMPECFSTWGKHLSMVTFEYIDMVYIYYIYRKSWQLDSQSVV